MLQLINQTGLPTQLFALPDPDGVDALHVIVKATFALTPDAPLAAAQAPVGMVDERVGEGASAWLRRPSELHPAKARCEVLLEGEAVAPRGRSVGSLDVTLSVGPWRRALRVTGDRRFTGRAEWFCTEPVPFTRMPLTPERAFGGCFAPEGITDARNPAGAGFAPEGLRDLHALRDHRLPNIEDPEAPLRRPGDRPVPALVGPVAPSWSPRAERAGTYDDVWDRGRAPFLPTDFDPLFLQAAPEAMWLPARLVGAELITLRHLAEEPTVEARVPSLGLRVRARLRGEERELRVEAETLHLFPGDGVATLTHRATLRCGHRPLDVASVEVTAEGIR